MGIRRPKYDIFNLRYHAGPDTEVKDGNTLNIKPSSRTPSTKPVLRAFRCPSVCCGKWLNVMNSLPKRYAILTAKGGDDMIKMSYCPGWLKSEIMGEGFQDG